jgi:hypothetical protein
VRIQLLHAVREAAVDGVAEPTAADGLAGSFNPAARPDDDAAAAFARLPERWRSVLWLREVECLDATEVGAILGMTAPSADQLSARAFGGLREQLGQAHVHQTETPDCQRTAIRLSGYVAGTLTPRDEIRVRRHLDRCEPCRSRLDEVDDLAPRLRRTVRAVPLALGPVAATSWLMRTRTTSGPLGLRLPGGRSVPGWAERSLAGAAAAVVTLGVTAAVILGARGGRDDEPNGPVTARTQPVDTDRETASGPTGDDVDLTPPDPPASAPRSSTPADTAETPARATAPVTQTSGAPRAAPPPPPRSAGSVTPPPTVGPAPEPDPTPPPAPVLPPVGVIDAVDEVLEPLDLCLGAGPLDDLTGCDEAEGTSPLGGLL